MKVVPKDSELLHERRVLQFKNLDEMLGLCSPFGIYKVNSHGSLLIKKKSV